MSGYDPLTDDEMAELIENPMLVHLYDAHRLVAALATIATLRAEVAIWRDADVGALRLEIATLRAALDGLVKWVASRDATNWSPGWSEDYRNGYDTAVEEVRAALATAKSEVTK